MTWKLDRGGHGHGGDWDWDDGDWNGGWNGGWQGPGPCGAGYWVPRGRVAVGAARGVGC